MLKAIEALEITKNFDNIQTLLLHISKSIKDNAQKGERSSIIVYVEKSTYSTEAVFKKLKENGYSVEAEFEYDPEPAYSFSFKGIRTRTVTLKINW